MAHTTHRHVSQVHRERSGALAPASVSGAFVFLIVIWGLADAGGVGNGDASILDVIGIGLVITIIAPICQIVGAFKLEEE